MKTQFWKIGLAALLGAMLAFPKFSFSQDEQDPYYQAQYGGNYDSTQGSDQTPPNVSPDNQPISQQVFYDQLSPYGQWVNYGNYGYVWIPNAGPNFVPYSTAGHWIYTDYGWTWASDYGWGWAPFHYGRWIYDGYYGWMWVPGTEWAPAWVAWRNCDGYYGWAPLGPGMVITVGYDGDFGIAWNYWVFVDAAYINSPWVYRYYVPRERCWDIYRRSTVIYRHDYDDNHRTIYSTGPERTEVERYVKTPVRTVQVRNTARPVQHYDVQHFHTYSPNVTRPEASPTRPAPTRPVNINQVPQRTYSQPRQQQARPAPSYNNGGSRPAAVPQRTENPRPMPTPVRPSGGGGGRHR